MALRNFEYETINGKYIIKNLKNKNLSEVIIPEGVKEIGYCAFSSAQIKKIHIPASVESISDSAFEFCDNLEEITFAKDSSLKIIHQFAFSNCSNLCSIVFPEGLETIDYNAFYGCSLLKEVYIPYSVTKMGANVFEDCESLKVINLAHNSIPSSFHMYWNEDNKKVNLAQSIKTTSEITPVSINITTITKKVNTTPVINKKVENKPIIKQEDDLSNFITEFTESGLLQIVELKNETISHLVIPSSVKCIKYSAFSNPNSINIKTVTAHKDLEFIGGHAFDYSNIESISNLSKKVFIADYAFAYCENLKHIYITNKTMKGAYMSCSSAKTIFIEDDTEYLEESVCAGCNSLEEVNIPDSVTNINQYAFSYCNSLKKIKFSKNLTRINEFAFHNCSSLKEIILTDELDWIESFAFEGCNNLENVVFGKKTYFTKKCAFRDCDKIRKITIPPSVKFIEKCAFTSKNLKEIIIERYAGEPHVMPQYFEKDWYNEAAKPTIKFKTVKK